METSPALIAQTNSPRSPIRSFGVKTADRFQHLYIIGQTGTGKSTLLESLAIQDMTAGHGIAIIDPHGDLAARLVRFVPAHRQADLIYLNPADSKQPFSYNPIARVPEHLVPLAASGLLEAMKKLWPDAWGVRMEHILRNTLYALIEAGGATLPDILRFLSEPKYRATVMPRVKNQQVRRFWLSEFPNYNPRYRQESIAPIQNKVGALLADPRLYRLFTGADRPIRFRRLMDNSGILIVNLSKGELGEDSANLLGAMLVSTLGLAAMSRAALPAEARTPFFLYVDEFQSFTTESIANMISELRKYGVALILSHQHLFQLEPAIRHAVLGNVGTMIAFRLGVEDACLLEKEFHPVFGWYDLINLRNYDIYIKLLIDGMPSRPFSATTFPPDQSPINRARLGTGGRNTEPKSSQH